MAKKSYGSFADFFSSQGIKTDTSDNKGKEATKKVSDCYEGKYVSAPYNFIPFYNDVVEVKEEQLTNRAKISEELFSGEIKYKFIAKTPIFISDGKDNFFKNEYGKYAIPGSSVRGLIRSNVQILGLSSFEQDIDDYYLMYRNVAAGANKDYYNKNLLGADPITVDKQRISVLKKVEAGYITKIGDAYYIYKSILEQITPELCKMNYYVLSERNIQKHLEDGTFDFFKDNPQYLQHDLAVPFKKDKGHYKGKTNDKYIPYCTPISYEIENQKNVTAVGMPGIYTNEGYLVGTGVMQKKKALYVIPEINEDEEKRIKIPEADIKAYRIDFEKKKNTLKSRFKDAPEQLEVIYGLPKEGVVKPIFYIELGKKIYFGPTPRLRVFYDFKVKDGLKQKKTDFDLAKSIFGTSTDKSKFKSKVSFSDAIAYSYKEGEIKNKILAEPKPTSYLDYLKQSVGSEVRTYNTEDFELRGQKQYWLHEGITSYGELGSNENIGSKIKPLDDKTIFQGKVRFKNLTEAELGLLVWAIKLNKESCMNIGKAKAYGYGVIKLDDIDVKVLNPKRAYLGNLSELCSDIYDVKDPDELISAYKTFIKKTEGVEIDKLTHIKEFFIMKDEEHIPGDAFTRYMHLGDKKQGLKDEYKERTKFYLPLKSIEDIRKDVSQ